MTTKKNIHYSMRALPAFCSGLLLLILVAGASCSRSAQPAAPQLGIFSEWSRPDILELEINTDWSQLLVNKDGEQAAQILWRDAEGNSRQIAAAVAVRGVTRREVCAFPPLKLKFDEQALQSMGFNPTYDKLKLVTHCVDGNDELVLREYLTY